MDGEEGRTPFHDKLETLTKEEPDGRRDRWDRQEKYKDSRWSVIIEGRVDIGQIRDR